MNAKKRKGFLTLVLLLLFAFFSFTPAVSAASSVVSKGNTTQKVVALTFDDGSDGTNIPSLLKTLSSNGVKATFFLTGSGAAAHSQQIKNIVSQGHEIGNHSYSHPYFTKISATSMKNELQKTEDLIKKLTGKSTKPYFRPPYGDYNSTVLKHVGDAGYSKTIMWTIDTLDWKGISSSEITKRIENGLKPGAIILMHTGAGAKGTPGALPTILSRLKSKGYKFVTVSQLLGIKPASSTSQTYVVRPGDTLYGIAKKFGLTVQQIASANHLANINYISIGQTLTIPKPAAQKPNPTPAPTTIRYTVKAGDTLFSIARRFEVTVQQIATANRISNPNFIRVNQVLVIP